METSRKNKFFFLNSETSTPIGDCDKLFAAVTGDIHHLFHGM